MRSLRAAIFAAGLSIVAFVPTRSVDAQWVRLPTGEAAYQIHMTTTGTFTCLASNYRAGSCSSAGNIVTITDQFGGTATFTFTGFSAPLLVTAIGEPITMGVIAASTTPGFALPQLGHHEWPYFLFTGGLITDPARAAVSSWGGAYFRTGGVLAASQPNYGYATWTGVGLPPDPHGSSFRLLVVDGLRMPVLPTNGSVAITGSIALLPEPATVALLGSGLLVLGGVGAMRRHRTDA